MFLNNIVEQSSVRLSPTHPHRHFITTHNFSMTVTTASSQSHVGKSTRSLNYNCTVVHETTSIVFFLLVVDKYT